MQLARPTCPASGPSRPNLDELLPRFRLLLGMGCELLGQFVIPTPHSTRTSVETRVTWKMRVQRSNTLTILLSLKGYLLSSAVRHFTTGTTTESVHPLGQESAIEGIASLAAEIGMRVNVGKTQLLCISPNNGCITSATVLAGDDIVASADTMKLVGYTFGTVPTAEAHVMAIRVDY